MILKLLSARKRMFSGFEKTIFQFFANFWVTKVETIFWENEANRSKLFQSKFDHRKLLRKWFWSCINVKNECSERFLLLWKFLSGEIETIFCESQARRSKLVKSKFGYSNLLRKWFWSYLQLKNECSQRMKRTFFNFLQIFEWRSWNNFLGKWS